MTPINSNFQKTNYIYIHIKVGEDQSDYRESGTRTHTRACSAKVEYLPAAAAAEQLKWNEFVIQVDRSNEDLY